MSYFLDFLKVTMPGVSRISLEINVDIKAIDHCQ